MSDPSPTFDYSTAKPKPKPKPVPKKSEAREVRKEARLAKRQQKQQQQQAAAARTGPQAVPVLPPQPPAPMQNVELEGLTALQHLEPLEGMKARWLPRMKRASVEAPEFDVVEATAPLAEEKALVVDAASLAILARDFALTSRCDAWKSAFLPLSGLDPKNIGGFASPGNELVPIMLAILEELNAHRAPAVAAAAAAAGKPLPREPLIAVDLLFPPGGMLREVVSKKSTKKKTTKKKGSDDGPEDKSAPPLHPLRVSLELLPHFIRTHPVLRHMRFWCEDPATSVSDLRSLGSQALVLATPEGSRGAKKNVKLLHKHCVPVFELSSVSLSQPLRALVVPMPDMRTAKFAGFAIPDEEAQHGDAEGGKADDDQMSDASSVDDPDGETNQDQEDEEEDDLQSAVLAAAEVGARPVTDAAMEHLVSSDVSVREAALRVVHHALVTPDASLCAVSGHAWLLDLLSRDSSSVALGLLSFGTVANRLSTAGKKPTKKEAKAAKKAAETLTLKTAAAISAMSKWLRMTGARLKTLSPEAAAALVVGIRDLEDSSDVDPKVLAGLPSADALGLLGTSSLFDRLSVPQWASLVGGNRRDRHLSILAAFVRRPDGPLIRWARECHLAQVMKSNQRRSLAITALQPRCALSLLLSQCSMVTKFLSVRRLPELGMISPLFVNSVYGHDALELTKASTETGICGDIACPWELPLLIAHIAVLCDSPIEYASDCCILADRLSAAFVLDAAAADTTRGGWRAFEAVLADISAVSSAQSASPSAAGALDVAVAATERTAEIGHDEKEFAAVDTLDAFLATARNATVVHTAGHWHNSQKLIKNRTAAKNTATTPAVIPAAAADLALCEPVCPPKPGEAAVLEGDEAEMCQRDPLLALANYAHRFTNKDRAQLSTRVGSRQRVDGMSAASVACQSIDLLREARSQRRADLFTWQAHADVERRVHWTSKYGSDFLDPWQHRVRQLARDGRSALICAPTSAGKTWLSCRIIREQLEAKPNSVVVYMCPSKALANMVYDDLRADPSFKPGEVGIFTRDRRANEGGARVLVAVPAIVSILVLHTESETASWKHRISMFIFDEVHCICEENNAATVERLFCMLTCPFLAFSATFAGRERFVKWVNQLPGTRGRVALVTSDARPTEQQWTTSRSMILHPWRLFHPYECRDIELAPDLPLHLLLDTAWIFIASGFVRLEEGRCALGLSSRDAQGITEAPTGRSAMDRLLRHVVTTVLLDEREAACSGLARDEADVKRIRSQPFFVTRLTWKHVDLQLRRAVATVSAKGLPSGDAFRSHPVLRLFGGLKRQFPGEWNDDSHVAPNAQQDKKVIASLQEQGLLPALYFKQNRQLVEQKAMNLSENMPPQLIGHACPCSLPRTGNGTCPVRERVVAKLRAMAKSIADQVEDYDRLVDTIANGVGLHHAKLPYSFKLCVEELIRGGHLFVVFATSSLAVGVHTPTRTVILAGDGNETNKRFQVLTGADVLQMAGRAGRRGIHDVGTVIPLGLPRTLLSGLFKLSLPDLRGVVAANASFVYKSLALLGETNDVVLGQDDLGGDEVGLSAAVQHDLSIVTSVLTNNRAAKSAENESAQRAAVEMCRFGLEMLAAADAVTVAPPAEGWASRSPLHLTLQPASLLVQRFDYKEPRNLLCCFLVGKRAFPSADPNALLVALQRCLGFQLLVPSRCLRGVDDTTTTAVKETKEPLKNRLAKLEDDMLDFSDRLVECGFRSLRRQAVSSTIAGDWRSELAIANGLSDSKRPPGPLHRISCAPDVGLVTPILNATARGYESIPTSAHSVAMVLMANPRITGSEIANHVLNRPWSELWTSFIEQRDELKKFCEVVRIMLQAVVSDALPMVGSDDEATLAELRKLGDLASVSADIVAGLASNNTDSTEAEPVLSGHLKNARYLGTLIRTLDRVRQGFRSVRGTINSKAIDAWTADKLLTAGGNVVKDRRSDDGSQDPWLSLLLMAAMSPEEGPDQSPSTDQWKATNATKNKYVVANRAARQRESQYERMLFSSALNKTGGRLEPISVATAETLYVVRTVCWPSTAALVNRMKQLRKQNKKGDPPPTPVIVIISHGGTGVDTTDNGSPPTAAYPGLDTTLRVTPAAAQARPSAGLPTWLPLVHRLRASELGWPVALVPADVPQGACLEQFVAASISNVVPTGTAHTAPIIVTTTFSPKIASVTAHLGAACVVVGPGSDPKMDEAYSRVRPSAQCGGTQTLEGFLYGDVADAVRGAVEALVVKSAL